MGLLREAIGTAAESDRLLLLSLAAFWVELLVRAGLAWEVSSLLAVLWPPLIAVGAFGLGAARDRRAAFDAPPVETTTEWLRLAGALAAVAIGGHAVAVFLGGAAFVVVDTPLRALAYWLGFELLASDLLALGLPFLGLAVGTAIAWALPAVVAVAVSTGTPLRDALRYPLAAIAGDPWTLATIGLANALVVLAPVVAFLAGFAFTAVLLQSFPGFLAVFAALLVVCGTLSLSVATAASGLGTRRLSSRVGAGSTAGEGSPSVPVARLAVVLVLVVGLATIAGAVRTTEVRPTDTAAEPLGDRPQEMYDAALANTFRGSHTVISYPQFPGGETTVESAHDLERRAVLVTTGAGEPRYSTVGTGTDEIDSIVEWVLRNDRSGAFRETPGIDPAYVEGYQYVDQLPATDRAGGWERIDRERDGDVVLESTDVAVAVRADHVDPSRVIETHEAWVRARVDPATRTLRSIEYLYNVTLDQGDPDAGETVTGRGRWEFRTDPAVDRPDAVSRSVADRLWKVLVY